MTLTKPLKMPRWFPRNSRMRDFRAHINIYIEKRNYIVKTADSNEEFRAALKLRHEVFLDELLSKTTKSGFDIDRFDKTCDHLLIIDKNKDNKVIGTYRLQSSLHTKRWYTATEFHVKEMLKNLPGNKLELGRACVHKDYRNGVTIALLWEGIHAYIQASQTNYLFGCSSIKTTNKDEIKGIYHYLKSEGHLTHDHGVRPKGKFRVPGFAAYVRKVRKRPQLAKRDNLHVHKEHIPPLLKSYLKVGAKVCGVPALDRDFRCIDFLTLLNVRDIGDKYNRKFGQE